MDYVGSVTLVFAWMGAPWSSRISVILTWPFLAAQCRGVSSSWRKRIFSDSLDGAPNYIFGKKGTPVAPWSWHQSALLCPTGAEPWSHSPAWMQCAEEWYHSGQKNRRTYRRAHQRGRSLKLLQWGLFSYLWGKVDISTSVEQQLSYSQVFVMCSDV